MKVILFGASGMVGQGALRACRDDPEVDRVLSIVRRPTGVTDPKVHEVVHADFADFTALAGRFTGYDACLFCVGVSSAGMREVDYTRVTYDATLAAANAIVRESPQAAFVYVTGVGTDSSEKGRSMWARVKGRTENALLAMPFRAAYMARPGAIQAVDGVRSRTTLYRVIYALLGWSMPLWRALFPNQIITTTELGRAMIEAAKHGAPAHVLEPPALVALGRRGSNRVAGNVKG